MVGIYPVGTREKNLFDFSFMKVIVQKEVSLIVAIKQTAHESLIRNAGYTLGFRRKM